MGQWITAMVRALEREQDRWFLWVPVLLGCGIAAYFALTFEPPPMLAAGSAMIAAFVYWRWREGSAAALLGGLLLALVLGFALAQMRAMIVAAPVIASERATLDVTGWVELVEPREQRGQRLTIRVHEIRGLAAEQRPLRIRVRTLKEQANLKSGDPVTFRAALSPPSGPSLPGGYDFARQAWFQMLGGVGYTLSEPKIAKIDDTPPWDLRIRAAFNRLRQEIARRVAAVLPNETGAIAVSLITGERGAITTATNAAYRDSGLIHILSISGLHMAIMAGAMFFTIRFLLSLVPAIALRFDIRKWAAVAGAIGALGYLLISGAAPPAIRSFLMILIMFAAILMDRPALALRNVALAALAMLIVTPESLIDVGFQMSFAAVAALVAGYEAWRDYREQYPAGPVTSGMWRAPLLFLVGIIASTLLASISVAPIGIYHFHQSQQYAMLANLVAVPMVNLVIMPAALATLLAMPLGLEAAPLVVMGVGIDFMTGVAYWVASLSGAVIRVPAIPVLAFGLMIAGGAWLLLWRTRLRMLGIVPIAAGLALTPFEPRPDIIVSRSGTLIAARDATGRLVAIAERSDLFDLGRWLEQDGDGRSAAAVSTVPSSGSLFRCDANGCVATIKDRLLAAPRHASALRDDCDRAGIIVLRDRRPHGCGASAFVIDREARRSDGAFAIRLAGGDMHIATVAGVHGERPWTVRLEMPEAKPLPQRAPRRPPAPVERPISSELIDVAEPDGDVPSGHDD
jgi:competence protein ComEC